MLERFLAPKAGAAYVLMRVVIGLLFAFHGVQGLFGVLGGHQAEFGTQIWFGKVLELVAGTAVALGAFTTWAAFLASGEMAVAYVQFHWKLQGGAAAIPAVNEGEPALMYSVVFLYIACVGGGACSIDRMRRRRAATT
jgi:putative oxidoreductase